MNLYTVVLLYKIMLPIILQTINFHFVSMIFRQYFYIDVENMALNLDAFGIHQCEFQYFILLDGCKLNCSWDLVD